MKKIPFIILIVFGNFNFSAQEKALMEVKYVTKIASESLNKQAVLTYSSTLLANQNKSVYIGYPMNSPFLKVVVSGATVARLIEKIESFFRMKTICTNLP